MSEFRASEIKLQTVYKLHTNYGASKVALQTVYEIYSKLRAVSMHIDFVSPVRSPVRAVSIHIDYLRSAQVKDMTKPQHVSKVVMQTIYEVAVTAQLADVCALVLQSKEDQKISPTPGGLFQTRVY